MSSALVRQALEFVDQEETSGKRGKRRVKATRHPVEGQDPTHPYKRKSKKAPVSKPSGKVADENIKKLLALSRSTADHTLADKIVQRAIKGRPLLENKEVKPEEEKSILFPDEEPHSKFEREFFCS